MNSSRNPNLFASLIIWLLITFVAAGVGAIGSSDAKNFYISLNLPSWAPSPAVFGPVWTALYVLIAISAWLAWKNRSPSDSKFPFLLFLAQLALNALWSWLFFHFKSGGLAFSEICVLLGAVLWTAILFSKISKLSAGLLIPYLAWLCFAAYLNFTVWQMNPATLS